MCWENDYDDEVFRQEKKKKATDEANQKPASYVRKGYIEDEGYLSM